MALDKIVVIKKKTLLEELVRRHATTSQVKFFLESRGESYTACKEEHEAYKAGFAAALKQLPSNMPSQLVDKEQLGSFQFGNKELVVVVGGPGLFANAAKYVGEQPILMLNPDPSRFSDVFTSCPMDRFSKVLGEALAGKAAYEQLTLAEAKLEDGQVLYALNDFLIGRRTHISARYEISHEGRQERQSSSGIIVSTGSGSSGWLTSVYTAAYGVAGTKPESVIFPREADYLRFAVREAFPSKTTGTSMLQGEVSIEEPLRIVSYMPEEGVIFSDGVEQDYLEFNAGKSALIMPAERKVVRVVG